MVYLTAYRNTTPCVLHVVIVIAFTFFVTSLARLNLLSELLPGIAHILVGFLAFYHAVASLTKPSPDISSCRSARRCGTIESNSQKVARVVPLSAKRF
jgi:hypothetical protein